MSRHRINRLAPKTVNKRCINCSLRIRRTMQPMHIRSLEEASIPFVNLLQSWITPTQLSSESVLCPECLVLLQDRAKKSSEGSALPLPEFGHRSVCLACGASILRATKTYPVRQDRQEINILLKRVPLHLVSRIERVCAACWRSAVREIQHQNQHDSNHAALPKENLNITDPPPLPQQNIATTQKSSKITSSMYRRAANTANHCIFVNCSGLERLLIPSNVKVHLLLKYKFYVPPGARICRHHLKKGNWSELNSRLKDFTGTQFDLIMNMMQRTLSNQLDFTNILTMPEHLCHYWLGMNSDQFYDLLNSIPNLAEKVPNASVALSIYLVKLKTGDSNERLATLFNKPRATLERWMNAARDCVKLMN